MYDIWIKHENFQPTKISFGGKDVNDLIKQIKEELKPDFNNVAVNRIMLQKGGEVINPGQIVNGNFDTTSEAPLTIKIIETTDPAILTRLDRLEARLEGDLKTVIVDLKKAKSVHLSKIGLQHMSAITNHLKLTINVINWIPQQDNITSSEPFTWKSKLNENKQANEYKEYLSKILSLPTIMEWYHAQDNQQFLTVTGNSWLPFDIKGTTDLAILDIGYSKAKGQEATGARVLFELKKDTIGALERYQAQVELILANHWSKYHVLVVLSDLNEYWEIMWENGNEICIVYVSRDSAIKIIQDHLNGESKNVHQRIDDDGYPLSKRKKMDTSTTFNDVANFKDFADEMTDMELKQKMVEHFLREVYIPSSPYGQLINTEPLEPSYISYIN